MGKIYALQRPEEALLPAPVAELNAPRALKCPDSGRSLAASSPGTEFGDFHNGAVS